MVNKKRKPIYLTFMLSLVAVLLFACSGGGSANQNEPAPQANNDPPPATETSGEGEASVSTLEDWGKVIKEKHGGTEIKMAFATHPSTEAFQKMTKGFEDLTGIKVRWEVMEQTYLKNKQLLDFTANTGTYDVFLVDNFWTDEYVSKKVLEPLNPYLEDANLTPEWFDTEDFVPAYMNGLYKVDGVLYGIPVAGETRFIGYRTDLFEKYGKEPPKTMDEYLELARFFNGKEPGLYGVSMRAQRGIHFASGLMSTMYNFSDGFIDQETGEITVNDPKTIEALQFYVDLLENAPPDVASYTHEEAISAFMSGKTALWLDSTAIAPWILDPSRSTIYENVDFVPTPEGPAGRASALAGWGLSIPEGSKNKEAAWAFIVYMMSKEMSDEYLAQGGVPVRVSQFQDKSTPENEFLFPKILRALEDANALIEERGISWVPPHDKLGQILDRVGYYGSMVLSKEMTADEAFNKAQIEIEEIVTE